MAWHVLIIIGIIICLLVLRFWTCTQYGSVLWVVFILYNITIVTRCSGLCTVWKSIGLWLDESSCIQLDVRYILLTSQQQQYHTDPTTRSNERWHSYKTIHNSPRTKPDWPAYLRDDIYLYNISFNLTCNWIHKWFMWSQPIAFQVVHNSERLLTSVLLYIETHNMDPCWVQVEHLNTNWHLITQ
jgi:hypothetical protein